jgi:hypothetical protein
MTALEPAMPHQVVLTTRLDRAEVERRLRAGVGHWMNAFTDKPARGLVFVNWAMLMSSRWFTSHTPLRVRFIEQPGGGTRLECQAGMAIASLVTIALLIVMGLIASLGSAIAHAPLPVMIVPALLIAASLLGFWIIAVWTRRSHAELLAYVRTLLEATDAPASVVA